MWQKPGRTVRVFFVFVFIYPPLVMFFNSMLYPNARVDLYHGHIFTGDIYRLIIRSYNSNTIFCPYEGVNTPTVGGGSCMYECILLSDATTPGA